MNKGVKLINLVLICIILMMHFSYADDDKKMNEYPYYEEKDPFVAGLLSATMMGLGQFYVKDYTSGSLFVLTDLVQKGMLIWMIVNFSERYTNDANYDNIVEWKEISGTDKGLVLGFIAFYFGSRVYCIIDAMSSAKEYNENLKRAYSYNGNAIQLNYDMYKDNHFVSLNTRF